MYVCLQYTLSFASFIINQYLNRTLFHQNVLLNDLTRMSTQFPIVLFPIFMICMCVCVCVFSCAINRHKVICLHRAVEQFIYYPYYVHECGSRYYWWRHQFFLCCFFCCWTDCNRRLNREPPYEITQIGRSIDIWKSNQTVVEATYHRGINHTYVGSGVFMLVM